MKRVNFLCVAGATLLAATVRAAAPVTVSQNNLQFNVEELSVTKGQIVVFVNQDKTAHNITVTGEGVNLNGGLQQPGGEFRVPFAKVGTYQVSCGIHPKMKLSVTVK